MKISLNWVFDHIVGDVQKIVIADLVERFIKTTAEIEEWKLTTLAVDRLTLARVIAVFDDIICVKSYELQQEYVLPFRSDAAVDLWYMIELNDTGAIWATIHSLGGTKDTVLPAIHVDKELQAGAWKDMVELNDYIIDIDNKSINHRPDLWGHRGIAREIAAIFELPFLSLDQFVVDKKVNQASTDSLSVQTGPFIISIESRDVCKSFSACYVKDIVSQPSSIDMVIRLSRLDSRSIDYVVDSTNYVMFDLGHPMHAFDANMLGAHNIDVRRAQAQEKITILDGQTIHLAPEDIIVADGDQPISLAGVMGGLATGVTRQTTSLLLEAAHFDATTIRRTAARHKKRTEASMRFEKSLDPCHTADMIKRFLFLLDKAHIAYNDSAIVQLIDASPPGVLSIAHKAIEQRLGICVSFERVKTILEKLECFVDLVMHKNDVWYAITPPSFRVTKDIKIAEDIIEEVGRYVGYDSIEPCMPAINTEPANLDKVYCVRRIKHLLSTGLLMRELYDYSFFDESFLRKINWSPELCVDIKNPISENYTRLVSTLQPHLLKAIADNSIHHKKLRFYEWARVWNFEDSHMTERQSLSGVFFEQDTPFDFYDGKSLLTQLFDELHMSVVWKKSDTLQFPWLHQHQTAVLLHNDRYIGRAGIVEQSIVDQLTEAGATLFIFELDGDYILNYKQPSVRFVPLAKYPSVRRDVSLMVPLSGEVEGIATLIKEVDARIELVTLFDFFTKPEWHNQKAITFHVEIRDKSKTLDHDEVENIWGNVIAQLQSYGATIR